MDLASYLAQGERGNADAGTVRITSDDLERLWSALIPEETYATRRGLDALLEGVEAQADLSPGATLEFRPGGWQVDMHKGVVQSVVAGALIAGLLVALGATQIPAAIIPTVIPLFFDVEKVRLTAGQEQLLAELVGHAQALDGTLTAQELYEQLPEGTRSELSSLDFADFVDTCRRAGLADIGENGTIVLRPATEARFRISVR
jgi:hypothetical protein